MQQDRPTMWLANLAACLTLWASWMSALHANFTRPSEPGMMDLTQRFQDFMVKFNKTYNSREEMMYRLKVFAQNMEISQVLQDTELGTAQYGITPFSDVTESEFAMRFGNPVARAAPLVPTQRHPSSSMPFRFCDWRKAKVSTVKKQGNCSSCWAFAAVSNIEALWKIHRKINCSLSVQELVDCTYPSRGGCSGGYVWDAFQFVVNNTGLSSSKLYPYTGKKQHCQKYKRRKLTKIDGYSILPRDERYIAKVVATQGPVTALMNAKVIQHYRTGIIHRAKVSCDPNWLDHVVLIVGFGEGNIRRGTWSGLYWIIQNSWGKEWGEEGYFRMDRGSNTCGIAQYAATATVQNLGGEKPPPCPK